MAFLVEKLGHSFHSFCQKLSTILDWYAVYLYVIDHCRRAFADGYPPPPWVYECRTTVQRWLQTRAKWYCKFRVHSMMTSLYSEQIPVAEITSDWCKFHFPLDSRVITCVNLTLDSICIRIPYTIISCVTCGIPNSERWRTDIDIDILNHLSPTVRRWPGWFGTRHRDVAPFNVPRWWCRLGWHFRRPFNGITQLRADCVELDVIGVITTT